MKGLERHAVAVGYLVLLAMTLVVGQWPAVRQLELAWIDAQARWLAQVAAPPLPLEDDPVIVGIDEATLAELVEPVALWHRALGDLLLGISQSGARALMLDLALPERSLDRVQPGIDAALLTGLRAVARQMPLTVALMAGPDGQPRPVMPSAVAVAGPAAFTPALLPLDDDGRVRRVAVAADAHRSMGLMLARQLGHRVHGDERLSPWLGRPFNYLPLHQVLAAQRAGDHSVLRRWMAGRVIVLGSVLAYSDRVGSARALAAWEPEQRDVPGVLVHAQALRSVLSGQAVRPLPSGWSWVLALLASLLWWLPPMRWRLPLCCAGLATIALLSLACLAAGWYLGSALALRAALLAMSSRTSFDLWRALRERARLHAAFSGYVSPQILRRLVAEGFDPRAVQPPREMAFLFADLRGFTGRGEHESATTTVALLNRYYDAIIPPIHRAGGMVDNFRGDGIMVVFGAPQDVPEPAQAALRAARGMVLALRTLNGQLACEGHGALEMGIGIACGQAVAAEIGSRERHDYTAIGDDVNVAARLQDLCRVHRAAVVVAERVAATTLPADTVRRPLGDVTLRGHSAVRAVALDWPDPSSPLTQEDLS